VCLVGLIAAGHAGVPRYAASLLRALDAAADQTSGLDLSLLITPAGAEAMGIERIPVHPVRLGGGFRAGPGRILAEQLASSRRRADLLHFFDMTGPLLAPSRPFVATLHDVSVAHGFSRYRQAYKRFLYPWVVRRARRVVTVSDFARREAIEHLGADPARLEVVHSGPGLVERTGHVGESRTVEWPYLLFVGNLTASKNLPFLVRAFDEADVSCGLLLVGRPAERFSEVQEAVAASPRRERIRIVHDVSDDELDLLYRQALALVLPSRYEGFAFTPLEAMARDCPVLASDLPAIREVSGGGAVLLPPDDVAAWADALRRVSVDETLRAELRRRGAEAVARFSWDRTARRLCEVFLAATDGS
jgi:glycosyltransferase involved in cell wall biosynthesis